MDNRLKKIRNRRYLTISLVGIFLTFSPYLITSFVARSFYVPTESMMSTLHVNDRLSVDLFVYKTRNPKHGEIVVFRAPISATNGKELDFIKRCVATEGDTVEVVPPRLMSGNRELDSIAMTGQDWHRLLREILTTQEGSIKFLDSGVSIDGAMPVPTDEFQLLLKNKIQEYEKINEPSLVTIMAKQLVTAGPRLQIIPGRTIVNGQIVSETYTREDPDYVLPILKINKGELFVLGDNRNFSYDSHMFGPIRTSSIMGRANLIWFPLNRMQSLK